MHDRTSYEVVVVGGGPAGMTTALYATRLGHRTAVVEERGGRHAAVDHVHNLYGVSEDVSGRELSAHAVAQFEEYGGDYYPDSVTAIHRRDDADGRRDDADDRSDDADGRFVVTGGHSTLEAERVVLATGFSDREPAVPDLQQFSGRGLHYCLHCDAYVLGDGRVFVLGCDDHAATVAMLMLNFTADVDLLLDGDDPEWSDDTGRQLAAHPVDRVDREVVGAYAADRDATDANAVGSDADERRLGGLTFADGTERAYRGGFAVYGKEYNTSLAKSLGCDLADDGAIAVDDDHETSVDGVFAVGDVTHGQNQTVIAMGDGARAGMALHKQLRRFPLSVADADDPDADDADDADADDADDSDDDGSDDGTTHVDASAVPAVADDLRARMRLLRDRDVHAGLRGPSPNR
ncbi:NAD(P)/FAD-dependent oxidoreductase [Halorubellus sp. JP-L1]|uniref:NAD(P)/FAD-dependent oxidoreductase n=1 Tax=Halorubellus sp. JP-L1 TaxID=2715753 RepID=UPI00140C6171|nr:NAD(P)/FAD-dependent oxidoreductase [Halorubellus sp. JP-L1]NHN41160.1 NAD(P)/FAD-dependent oxidoreductase [Halorubellus sp. JP-L1]